MQNGYTRVKTACYLTNISMSIVGNLAPLLFLTFRDLYDISYSLLGLLVLINFSTQLIVDLIFSFMSHKINMQVAVKITPLLTLCGLVIYGLTPFILPGNVYFGLVLGTVIFSASGGLSEVLISPVIAAIPSKNPEGEMSKLHSIYAWGVVGMVAVTTLFLLIFKNTSWMFLSLIYAVVPLLAFILFSGATLPELKSAGKKEGARGILKRPALWLSVFAIFLGGAAECTMAQWASGYIEGALGIPKLWGDIFGVAMFSVMLGLGRSMYAKFGKNIERVMFFGAIGATVCYLVAALLPVPLIGLVACGICGFCVSMLWPGSLIVVSDRVDDGVMVFALMAAGGDLGASVGPQLMGVVTDVVAATPWAQELAQSLSVSPDKLGMRAGILLGMLFPLTAVFVYLYMLKTKRKDDNSPREETPIKAEAEEHI